MNLPDYFFRGLTVLNTAASFYVLSQSAMKTAMKNEMSLLYTFNHFRRGLKV